MAALTTPTPTHTHADPCAPVPLCRSLAPCILGTPLARAPHAPRSWCRPDVPPARGAAAAVQKVMAAFLQARDRLQTKLDNGKDKPQAKEEEAAAAKGAAPAKGLAGLSEAELAKLSVEEIDAMLAELSA
jgi:hypothetical protein